MTEHRMTEAGMQLAIKRVGYSWRVYTVTESDRFGPYAKAVRDEAGRIRNFGTEAAARDHIESTLDATEVDYPE